MIVLSKHQLILTYIESLSIGSKISVRQIAKDLNVSEGTAYRAMKEAENKGYVSSIERVGTVRIQKKERDNIEQLNYAEIVNIVEGQLVAGRNGLHNVVKDFAIAAMDKEQVKNHIHEGTLLIVGNRLDVIKEAIDLGCAILMTGGFFPPEELKTIANSNNLPIIVTSHDSFSVAHLINRATNDQLIKKEILTVENIMLASQDIHYLKLTDNVATWYEQRKKTGHTRFPVLNDHNKLVGIITPRDIVDVDHHTPIRQIMKQGIITTSLTTPISTVAYTMLAEGIELVPVIDNHNELLGLVSRQIVFKALMSTSRQPQNSDTFDEIVRRVMVKRPEGLQIKVLPQMLDQFGTVSRGVLMSIINEAVHYAAYNYNRHEVLIDNISIYFLRTVSLNDQINTRTMILDFGRKSAKLDVELYVRDEMIGKAIITCQTFSRI